MLWLSLSLVPLLAGGAESSPSAAPAADAGTTVSPAQAASPLSRFDALWMKRDQPGAPKQLQQIIEETQGNTGYAMLWRHAAFLQWQADGIQSDDYKKMFGKQCWELADQAAAKDATRVEAQYYGAACIGAYSEGTGIVSALSQGLESKFNGRLDKAIQMDPRFSHCGPLIAKARYFFKLPWPKRDLDQSAQWYQKAITSCPEALRAYVWLAETQLDQDHPQQARATLQKALDGSIDYDPPEGRRVKTWAKDLQKKIEKELK